MSQTTRCPSCATLFKVVADQLRISDGWVRCGHCNEIFDASQSLQTLVDGPLMPELPLDQLRAPLQAVEHMATPRRYWGDEHSERSDAMSSPVQAPALSASDAVWPPGWAQQASDDIVFQVPKRDIPTFLAPTESLDRAATYATDPSAEPSPAPRSESYFELTVSQGSYGADHIVADKDDNSVSEKGGSQDGGFVPAVDKIGFSCGYELPAAVLPESDVDWLEEDAEHEADTSLVVQGDSVSDGSLGPLWSADANAGDTPSSWQDVEDTTETVDTKDTSGADEISPASADGPEVPNEQLLEEDLLDSAPEPSFVRAARRQALWRKPVVRAMLWLVVIVLTAALLLQVALQQRNYLAAAWPQWRPYLEATCVPLQCRVDTYREISSVVVDSSSFDKLQGNNYQFVITLKNRSDMELEMPAVELTLTDAGDQPVLRRVFTLPNLSAPPTLSARGEWAATLQVQLAPSDSTRIASYRVLAFYP